MIKSERCWWYCVILVWHKRSNTPNMSKNKRNTNERTIIPRHSLLVSLSVVRMMCYQRHCIEDVVGHFRDFRQRLARCRRRMLTYRPEKQKAEYSVICTWLTDWRKGWTRDTIVEAQLPPIHCVRRCSWLNVSSEFPQKLYQETYYTPVRLTFGNADLNNFPTVVKGQLTPKYNLFLFRSMIHC